MSHRWNAHAHSVWLPTEVFAECKAEASRCFPQESGGTFMGYVTDTDAIVVTALIGPGPNATRSRSHFQPDEDWQLSEIARHYAQSGRRETYIGDWHSHPNALSGKLSRLDRRVLKNVIKTPEARCANPLMALLYGRPSDWQLAVWRAQLKRRAFFGARMVVNETRIIPWQTKARVNAPTGDLR